MNFYYSCPFSTCDNKYDSPVQLSAFPWCPGDAHERVMDFIESKSSGVPRHVQEDTNAQGRKRGGNWIKE